MMTTDTRAQLLRGILEEPRDTTRRLIFADWLEENGELEHAEFIRTNELSPRIGLDAWMPIQGDNRIGNEPDYDLTGPVFFWSFGFISHVRCTCDEWREHGPAICVSQPVERLELTDLQGPDHMRTGRRGVAFCLLRLNATRHQVGLPPLKTQESPCTTSQT